MPESSHSLHEIKDPLEEIAQLRNDLQSTSAKLDEVAKERDEARDMAARRGAALAEIVSAIPRRFQTGSSDPVTQIAQMVRRLYDVEDGLSSAVVGRFMRELKL